MIKQKKNKSVHTPAKYVLRSVGRYIYLQSVYKTSHLQNIFFGYIYKLENDLLPWILKLRFNPWRIVWGSKPWLKKLDSSLRRLGTKFRLKFNFKEIWPNNPLNRAIILNYYVWIVLRLKLGHNILRPNAP